MSAFSASLHERSTVINTHPLGVEETWAHKYSAAHCGVLSIAWIRLAISGCLKKCIG